MLSSHHVPAVPHVRTTTIIKFDRNKHVSLSLLKQPSGLSVQLSLADIFVSESPPPPSLSLSLSLSLPFNERTIAIATTTQKRNNRFFKTNQAI